LGVGASFEEVKLVVDEIQTFVVVPQWNERRVMCFWNLYITAVAKQIAVYWKLALILICLNQWTRWLELLLLSPIDAAYAINIPWERACETARVISFLCE
jgi:hypothetical protein